MPVSEYDVNSQRYTAAIETQNTEQFRQEAARMAIEAKTHRCRPSVLFKPKIYKDGNQWCTLYGENLQDGVAGFGDSPNEAMLDFDKK